MTPGGGTRCRAPDPGGGERLVGVCRAQPLPGPRYWDLELASLVFTGIRHVADDLHWRSADAVQWRWLADGRLILCWPSARPVSGVSEVSLQQRGRDGRLGALGRHHRVHDDGLHSRLTHMFGHSLFSISTASSAPRCYWECWRSSSARPEPREPGRRRAQPPSGQREVSCIRHYRRGVAAPVPRKRRGDHFVSLKSCSSSQGSTIRPPCCRVGWRCCPCFAGDLRTEGHAGRDAGWNGDPGLGPNAADPDWA